jgi:hypothetical protein
MGFGDSLTSLEPGPHATLNLVCQIVCMICLSVLLISVARTLPSMLQDISHARLSMNNGATRTASIRFTVSKLTLCIITLVPCTLFGVAPFYPDDVTKCYNIITAAGFFYVTHKFLVYLVST